MGRKAGRNNNKLMGIYVEPSFMNLAGAVARLVGCTRTELFRRLFLNALRGKNAISDMPDGQTISQGRKKHIDELCSMYDVKDCAPTE